MRGGCRSFALVNIFFGFLIVACGDERRDDAAPPVSDRTPVGAVPDTASASDSPADTGARPATPGDSTPPASKPGTDVARAMPPEKTAPKPTVPAAKPPAPRPSDSPPAAPPAQTADSATADAPLRDAYHQAPRDTLPQQAYNGWKQFNLLCARCHGEDVMGTTIAPHLVESLKPTGPINTKELFVQTVCAGRPDKGMPAWCPLGLEMDKIEAIYLYVKGRSEGKIHPGRPAVKAEG